MPQKTKIDLEPGSVQETMLIPLWGRATYSRLYPEFIQDHEAEKIMKRLDHDFNFIGKTMGEYSGIGYLVRARRFDDAIREYIKNHPQATVVNLGAGMDTTFSRVDNGSIQWVNIDLPESITFRQTLIPEKERSKCIKRSAFDLEWLDEVNFDPDKGIFIFAGGLFMYFEPGQIRSLFAAIAEKFPGGELHFDSISHFGYKFMNKRLKKLGVPEMHFFVGDSRRQFADWSPKYELIEEVPFWHEIPRNPRWSKKTIMMMNMGDFLKTGMFIRLRIQK